MTYFSLWIRLLTLQYMWYEYASSFMPTLSSTYSHYRSMMKKRQAKCLGKDIYTLSNLRESNEELSNVCFKNLLKTPSYLTWGVEVIWFTTIPFLNYPRWHDRHFKVHKCKVWFGISLMLAPYLWKSCSTLVLSTLLEVEQRLSVGELLTALKYQI